ncbi:hypothetical protein IGJ02_002516 [Enterococcus sp. DIV0724b]|uniref:lytic exoenzyme target recognition domain-containing protein n=1 Tax=Enterococcus sp. DIV0724b TaxID=2774694 RepID=UPI003D2FDE90
MKKMFFGVACFVGLSVLGGVSFGSIDAAAVAYNSDYKDFVPDPKSNKEALEILKRDGDLSKTRFPLDKITTEQPVESTSPLYTKRSGRPEFYYVDEARTIYGLYQFRTNYLARVKFNWYDNGIPASAVVWTGQDRVYCFVGSPIRDTGVGTYDGGYYWRRFLSYDKGRPIYYWLNAWNLNDLVYR